MRSAPQSVTASAHVRLSPLLLLLLLLLLPIAVHGNIRLAVTADTRRDIDLGVFGFGDRGTFRLKVDDFLVDDKEPFVDANGEISPNEPIGFVLDPVTSAQAARVEKNYAKTIGVSQRLCFIDDPILLPKDPTMRHIFALNGKDLKRVVTEHVFEEELRRPGLYALFFYNCRGFNNTKEPLRPVAVSFTASATMFNIDESGRANYLSVGEQQLPAVFGVFTVVFATMTGWWAREMRRNAAHVQAVHKIMLFLVVVKTLSLFFESIKLARYARTGERSVIDVFYYVFLGVKGVTLFAVILLLGSGWSTLKAFLSEHDKKVLMILLPCQILINVSIAVIEESSEGNKYWQSWSDLLRILDVVCCCCVLLPIVWSMKNLRDAAAQDGKAAQALSRMRLFRTFYLVIVVFIYFTRIVLVMVEGTIVYDKLWMVKVLRELSAVAFYCYTGFKFRPMQENPYLNLEQEDLEELRERNELDGAGSAAAGGNLKHKGETIP